MRKHMSWALLALSAGLGLVGPATAQLPTSATNFTAPNRRVTPRAEQSFLSSLFTKMVAFSTLTNTSLFNSKSSNTVKPVFTYKAIQPASAAYLKLFPVTRAQRASPEYVRMYGIQGLTRP